MEITPASLISPGEAASVKPLFASLMVNFDMLYKYIFITRNYNQYNMVYLISMYISIGYNIHVLVAAF